MKACTVGKIEITTKDFLEHYMAVKGPLPQLSRLTFLLA
jgi:hypothetical protein